MSAAATAKFSVGKNIYEIPRSLIPANSYLSSLITSSLNVAKVDDIYTISTEDDDIPAFEAAFNYLVNNVFPEMEYLPTLDYLGIDPKSNYDAAMQGELYMREHMYQAGYEKHPMNTNPTYGLIKLTEELWNSIEIKRSGANLLFNGAIPTKRSWQDITNKIRQFRTVFSNNKLLMAGGAVLSFLLDTPHNDIDIFFYDTPADLAEEAIYNIAELFGYTTENMKIQEINIDGYRDFLARETPPIMLNRVYSDIARSEFPNKKEILAKIDETVSREYEIVSPNDNKLLYGSGFPHTNRYVTRTEYEYIHEILINPARLINIKRTKNSITLGTVQIILRLYRTPSEILHGFDVDCCAVGCDGTNIWLTPRAYHSLCTGTNRVNFNLLSPSYEFRLAKYGTRGIAIEIPNFDKGRVSDKKIVDYQEKAQLRFSTLQKLPMPYRVLDHKKKMEELKAIKQVWRPLQGLDLLLWLDYKNRTSRRKTVVADKIAKLSEIASDYDNFNNTGIHVLRLIEDIQDLANANDGDRDDNLFDQQILAAAALIPRDTDILSALNIPYWLQINNIPAAQSVSVIKYLRFIIGGNHGIPDIRKEIHSLLHIDPQLYHIISAIRPWEFPADLTWKTLNPGEQMTGTFHRTVLDDNKKWYQGVFYQL